MTTVPDFTIPGIRQAIFWLTAKSFRYSTPLMLVCCVIIQNKYPFLRTFCMLVCLTPALEELFEEDRLTTLRENFHLHIKKSR